MTFVLKKKLKLFYENINNFLKFEKNSNPHFMSNDPLQTLGEFIIDKQDDFRNSTGEF